jgi:hypothetical protein
VLSVDLAEISYKERVFVAWLADIVINMLDPFFHSIPNQFLGIVHSMIDNMAEFKIRTLFIFDICIKVRVVGFSGSECGW